MKAKLILVVSFLALGIFAAYGFLSRPATSESDPTEIEESHINWVSIEEAEILSQKEPRKILVDVYTNWCGWCKRMDKDTYEKAEVVDFINKNFYAVKFNAEQKEEIILGGRSFKHMESGRNGVHELAVAMLSGKMSYPSTVFFDEKLQLIYNIPGYQKAPEMMAILNFFHDEVYVNDNNLAGYIQTYKQEKSK